MNATDQTQTTLHVTDEATTHAVAANIAKACMIGDCLLLQGDLGAGKTAFARGFIQSLIPHTEVTSPTFNLVQTYETAHGSLWHFDLYRLKSPAEIEEIGLDEALETAITLIEWPDIARNYWPINALTIHLQPNRQSRTITLCGSAMRWKTLIHSLTTEFTS